jgi:hypothetical protein
MDGSVWPNSFIQFTLTDSKAICFASTNGMQQASQAIAYAGGFILVQFGLTSALNVFK